jgi:raffinose/stachyose/melibiose transport system permease protein
MASLAPASAVAERPPPRRAAVGAGRRGRMRNRTRIALVAYGFILPTMALAAGFVYFPAVSGLWHSLYNWSGIGSGTYIGLHNFVALASDPVMRVAVVNVVKLAVFNMLISVIVPLPVARLITTLRSERAQYAWRVLFVVPTIVPSVVIYLVWQFLYDPNFGPINRLLESVHLPPQLWLGSTSEALYAIMAINFPFVDALSLLIFIAGLLAIPRELTDAAKVDGCGWWAMFRRVELPLLKGQIRLVLVLNMIWTIQDYTYILILTQGGPVNATMVPGMYLYQNAFEEQNMGYAAAIGVVMFLITVVLTYVNLRTFRPGIDYSMKER